MHFASRRPRGRRLLPALTAAVVVASFASADAMAAPGVVYTQTNDPAGNVVQSFDRGASGRLRAGISFPTGDAGSAAVGGRQGAVALSTDEAYVYAVNAGSNTVTALRAGDDGLDKIGNFASDGVLPASVAERAGHVYVLNSGGTPNVTAFAVGADGTLTSIGSQDLAAGASGAAQVSVASDGSALVVSERLSNRLETLPLDADGRPGAPAVTPSSGTVPFGFAIGHDGRVIVSEAGLSTVSSYQLGAGGTLATITGSLAVGQGAACWVAVTPNGKWAYTGNASGSISGFRVSAGGRLAALDADGRTAVLTPSPRDLDASRNGRFLYAVSPGNAATGGRVTAYEIGKDGSLSVIDSVPAAAGLTGAAAA